MLFIATAVQAADPAGDWTHMQSISPRGYVCGRASAPLVIDGKLDDADWQAATVDR